MYPIEEPFYKTHRPDGGEGDLQHPRPTRPIDGAVYALNATWDGNREVRVVSAYSADQPPAPPPKIPLSPYMSSLAAGEAYDGMPSSNE